MAWELPDLWDMLKDAVINLLNALADRIRPCKHKWTMYRERAVRSDFGDRFTVMHFYCKECGRFTQRKTS